MTTLNGKVAIVTGASKGIGAGIARQFAKSGGKAVAIQADFSKTADIKRLFGAVRHEAVPAKSR